MGGTPCVQITQERPEGCFLEGEAAKRGYCDQCMHNADDRAVQYVHSPATNPRPDVGGTVKLAPAPKRTSTVAQSKPSAPAPSAGSPEANPANVTECKRCGKAKTCIVCKLKNGAKNIDANTAYVDDKLRRRRLVVSRRKCD